MNINMASVVQEIQVIRSLRKDLRDPQIPLNILNSIESIRTCIKNGTDTNGWKKVDWRNGGSGSGSVGGAGYSQVRTGHNSGQGNRNNFFNGRVVDNSAASSHYAFGGRQRQNNHSQVSEPPPSIPLTNTIVNPTTASVSSDGFRVQHPKYVSKFKKNVENVEDTILNTILLGKLNKFSEQNYDEIKEFITHIIDNGETEMIKCFMKLVFEKAASEEMFCPLYAKLLSELSFRYPVLLSEMSNLYSQYMEIFEEVPEEQAETYNEVCKRNVEKKYRRGYSQFLAELIKHDVINIEVFMKTVNKIIGSIELNSKNKDASKLNEEFSDCLMKIIKAIQTGVEVKHKNLSNDDSDDEDDSKEDKIQEIRVTLKAEPSNKIKPLTVRNPENIGMSNKARFTLLDIFEAIQKF
jgi:hypothetical protein